MVVGVVEWLCVVVPNVLAARGLPLVLLLALLLLLERARDDGLVERAELHQEGLR